MKRRDLLAYGFAALSMPALRNSPALAQAKYPDRPIKLVVPFAPGGVVDIIGRLWAEKMKSVLGTVVVENQGGAGGTIGAAEVSRAAPDGYTLLLGNTSTQVITPETMPRAPYDPVKNFAAISIIAVSATSITVNPGLPTNDLKSFIPYARENAAKMSYGSAGAGTLTNLTGEMFKQLIGAPQIAHIPYKGAGPAIGDCVSGHIPMVTPNVTGQVLDLHRAGKLRILAVAAPARLKGAPDIPTAEEAGLPGMVAQLFNGIFAPAGTPRPIIEQVAAATKTALADVAFQNALIKSGFEPIIDSGPDHADGTVRSEHARLAPVIRAAGMRPE